MHWNGDQLVPWNKNFILKWSDYTGTSDSNSPQKAWTHTCIRYTFEVEIIKKATKIKFTIKNVKVTAYYNQSASWVKSELLIRNDQAAILKHEQGHLDIAEKFARKMQSKMIERVNEKTYSCKGKNEEEWKLYANTSADAILDQIFNEVAKEWHEYEGEAVGYDFRTKHGMKHDEQAKYDTELNQLRE